MSIAAQRSADVAEAMDVIRQSVAQGAVDREALSDILSVVQKLADKTAYWNATEFPPAEGGELQARYLISQEPDESLTLYLNVMHPGKLIPPHNHTTWACVAAVEGEEHNYIYRRLDDGSIPGVGRLGQTDIIVVGPGTGVALMPDDIHSVEILGQSTIRHLHMYGRALETLKDRTVYDLANGTCKPMTIGVKTRK